MTKRGLLFYLKIYIQIISQDIKGKMSYRADFIISTVGMILTNLAGFATFWLVFQNFDNINGWTYYEVLFLYGFSLLALTPMQCLFDNNWNLRHHVYTGDFIKYCLKPINIYFYFISEVFDLKGIGEFVMGIGILIYAWAHLGIPVTVWNVAALIVMWITASLVMAGIMNIAASTCFWMQNSGYVMVTAFKFTEYTRYPIDMFNKVFRVFFSFIIPIAFVAYYPSMVVLRAEELPLMTYIAPLFSVLFFYVSYRIWMHGAKKYDGTGN